MPCWILWADELRCCFVIICVRSCVAVVIFDGISIYSRWIKIYIQEKWYAKLKRPSINFFLYDFSLVPDHIRAAEKRSKLRFLVKIVPIQHHTFLSCGRFWIGQQKAQLFVVCLFYKSNSSRRYREKREKWRKWFGSNLFRHHVLWYIKYMFCCLVNCAHSRTWCGGGCCCFRFSIRWAHVTHKYTRRKRWYIHIVYTFPFFPFSAAFLYTFKNSGVLQVRWYTHLFTPAKFMDRNDWSMLMHAAVIQFNSHSILTRSAL